MIYTNKDIDLKYTQGLGEAEKALSSIWPVRGPVKSFKSFKGLNGWVFEKTIRSCLEDELAEYLNSIEIEEQVELKGRATVDLLFGRAAIELKSGGLFADDSNKYSRYREYAHSLGYEYLYLTRQETCSKFVSSAIMAFGADMTFFLDNKNEDDVWGRFVEKIIDINGLRCCA